MNSHAQNLFGEHAALQAMRDGSPAVRSPCGDGPRLITEFQDDGIQGVLRRLCDTSLEACGGFMSRARARAHERAYHWVGVREPAPKRSYQLEMNELRKQAGTSGSFGIRGG